MKLTALVAAGLVVLAQQSETGRLILTLIVTGGGHG